MIIDAHANFSSGEELSALEREAAREYFLTTGIEVTRHGSIEDLLEGMKSHGVSKAVLAPLVTSTSPGEAERLNNLVAKAARESRAIIPFASVNPGCEGAAEELDRAVAELRLRGVKLSPNEQNFTLAQDEVWSLFETIEQLRIPVLLSPGFTAVERDNFSPEEANELIVSFPRVTFIFAHLARCRRGEATPSVIPEPNVYLETSHAAPEEILRAMEIFGSDRVLFGSDFRYNFYPGYEVEKITSLPVAEGEKRKMLYENAARLFSVEEGGGLLSSLLGRR
ncbi:MAG: amidohydrolase [Euryarchaeota archaeon]|nr:amidohydrolase [Euryarchaeota archaeon]